jgi:hypothetical protein
MKKSFVIHPFLFAVFPILFLFSDNIEQVSFSEILLPSAIVLGFTLLLVLLPGLVFRHSDKTGIIVSIFLLLFFSYGRAHGVMQEWQIGGFAIGRHRHLLLGWGMLFICGAYFIIKTRNNLRNITNILNAAAFALVLISLINIGVYEFKTKSTWQDNSRSMEGRATDTTDLGKASVLRDIYYIILDGYAPSRTLKEIYNFDNGAFRDCLTGKGFFVASKSQCNYATTFLSLASSLNIEYVNYLKNMLGVESVDRRVPYQMIRDSRAMNFLKSRGYKFIHFSSGWGATDHNKHADLEIKCCRVNEFLMVLIQTTMLKSLDRYFIGNDERERVLCTCSKLAEVHRIEEPKFVFAHINCPHPPYLFGANGEPVPEAKLKMSGDVWEQKDNYLNQLIFINKKVEMLVDVILSKSGVAPIVILQADHGTASTFSNPDSGGWDSPTNDMLRERMRIFNAYYLPQGGKDLLYDAISPVNTFRLIFNYYFNTNYELLSDLSYYSSYERPYEFLNVTDIVKYD